MCSITTLRTGQATNRILLNYLLHQTIYLISSVQVCFLYPLVINSTPLVWLMKKHTLWRGLSFCLQQLESTCTHSRKHLTWLLMCQPPVRESTLSLSYNIIIVRGTCKEVPRGTNSKKGAPISTDSNCYFIQKLLITHISCIVYIDFYPW